MKKLYTPMKINGLELKNRVVMSPMSVGHCVDGIFDEAAADFYRTRAEGGVGLIVFANMQWDKVRHAHNVPLLTDEKYIPTLKNGCLLRNILPCQRGYLDGQKALIYAACRGQKQSK